MRISRIAYLGLSALLVTTSAGAGEQCTAAASVGEYVIAHDSTDEHPFVKRVAQGTTWSVVEYGGKFVIVQQTGEQLSQAAGGVLSVGVGFAIAGGFGWWDAKHAPKEEKADAFFDAFIRAVPGDTVTYRDTFKAVNTGLIFAVLNSSKDDPIRSSWLGREVTRAVREGRIKLVPHPPPPPPPKTLSQVIQDGLVAAVEKSAPDDPIRSSWLGQAVRQAEQERRAKSAGAARKAAHPDVTPHCTQPEAAAHVSDVRNKAVFVHVVSPEESAKILKAAGAR